MNICGKKTRVATDVHNSFSSLSFASAIFVDVSEYNVVPMQWSIAPKRIVRTSLCSDFSIGGTKVNWLTTI